MLRLLAIASHGDHFAWPGGIVGSSGPEGVGQDEGRWLALVQPHHPDEWQRRLRWNQ